MILTTAIFFSDDGEDNTTFSFKVDPTGVL